MAKKMRNEKVNKEAVSEVLTQGKIKKRKRRKGGKKEAVSKAVQQEIKTEKKEEKKEAVSKMKQIKTEKNKEAVSKIKQETKTENKEAVNKMKQIKTENKEEKEAVNKIKQEIKTENKEVVSTSLTQEEMKSRKRKRKRGKGKREAVNKGEIRERAEEAGVSKNGEKIEGNVMPSLIGVAKKKKKNRRGKKKKKKNVQQQNGNKDGMTEDVNGTKDAEEIMENEDGIQKEIKEDGIKMDAASESKDTTEQGKRSRNKKRKREQEHDGMKNSKEMETATGSSSTKMDIEDSDAAKPKKKEKKKKNNTANDDEKEEGKNDKKMKQKINNKEEKIVKKVKLEERSHTPILHPSIKSFENMDKIRSVWASSKKEGIVLQEGDIEVIKNPFTCCYIHNLLENKEFLEGLKEELNQIELLPKNNDLYKFNQTPDLKKVTTPFISSLRRLLYNDVRQWLMEVTGLPLNDTVDMGSSRYAHTDVLLCHDDELEGRSIAFILYLVPPWDKEDGGSLDLFNTDGNGEPKDVVRSLLPEHNGFAFFKVSPVSFHQVSEVTAKDKTRLSINGWFHGPKKTVPKCPPNSVSVLSVFQDFEEGEFYEWINPVYLAMETQKEIRDEFREKSAMELENFLTDEAYEKLSKAFKGDLTWKRTYPANKRFYEVLGPDNMPPEVKKCQEFLKSEALFLVLSQLTGLKLHHMAPPDSEEEEEAEVSKSDPSTPTCRMEAQRWGHKCYTLMRESNNTREALDAFLFVNVSEKWTEDLGGHITYVAKDEEEEIMTVYPDSNCLSLVYRDAYTMRFTKYINASSLRLGPEGSRYHSFGCVYYE